jgi:hypothetical protein
MGIELFQQSCQRKHVSCFNTSIVDLSLYFLQKPKNVPPSKGTFQGVIR